MANSSCELGSTCTGPKFNMDFASLDANLTYGVVQLEAQFIEAHVEALRETLVQQFEE